MLLSFAQFEREVTGERIRDKIAASKKKGMWMGGVVPLGYRVEDRALHIVEEHAAIVREIPVSELPRGGKLIRLGLAMDQEEVRIPVRIDGMGRATGGICSVAATSIGPGDELIDNPKINFADIARRVGKWLLDSH